MWTRAGAEKTLRMFCNIGKSFSRGAFCWQILKFQTRPNHRPQARDKISKKTCREHRYHTRTNKTFETFMEGKDCVLFYERLCLTFILYVESYPSGSILYTKIEIPKSFQMNILVCLFYFYIGMTTC
jgi:hypothetical protein